MKRNKNESLPSFEKQDESMDEKTEGADFGEQEVSRLIETGSVISDNGRYVIQCMTIIGEIEGHYMLSPRSKSTKYEHIIPLLISAEQSTEIDGLLVILNTAGGDVEHDREKEIIVIHSDNVLIDC